MLSQPQNIIADKSANSQYNKNMYIRKEGGEIIEKFNFHNCLRLSSQI